MVSCLLEIQRNLYSTSSLKMYDFKHMRMGYGQLLGARRLIEFSLALSMILFEFGNSKLA